MIRREPHPAPTTGFTLIELMVVMLLISIVLAVAAPRFEGGIVQDPTRKMNRWMINAARNLRTAAIQKRTIQTLVADLNDHRLWRTHDQMTEQERTAAAENAFVLPGGYEIVDIQFPQRERITNGQVDIHFYPAGYSDHVLIHLENHDAQRITYRIEPLLPKIKVFEEWIDF